MIRNFKILFLLLLALQTYAQENKLAVSDFDKAYLQEIKNENSELTSRIKTFPQNIQDLNKQVSQAIKNNEDAKVLELAYEMDKLYPDNADIKNFIGKQKAKASDFNEALKNFDEAIKLDSKNRWFYINKATAQAENKQLEEALKTTDILISQYPNWSIAYNLKASLLKELNQQSESLRAYELAIIAEPKSALIYTNRGDLYQALSKEKEAIADYKKALQIQPDYERAQEKLNLILKTASEKK